MIWLTDLLQQTCNQVYSWIPQKTPSKKQLAHTLIVAHRGAWQERGHTENTLAAFKEALDHNIDAIEFDIRWTKDNIPVVFHDASTARVFKKDLKISELLFTELKNLFPIIPSLQEVVEAVAGRCPMMIELKTTVSKTQSQALASLLQNYQPLKHYYFMSLNPEHFEFLGDFPRQSFVTIARTNIKEIYRKTLENGWGGLTGQYLLLTESMKKNCKGLNIKVGTGFPQAKNILYREAGRDIDWVFTNSPIQLTRFKNLKN